MQWEHHRILYSHAKHAYILGTSKPYKRYTEFVSNFDR